MAALLIRGCCSARSTARKRSCRNRIRCHGTPWSPALASQVIGDDGLRHHGDRADLGVVNLTHDRGQWPAGGLLYGVNPDSRGIVRWNRWAQETTTPLSWP